MVVLIIFVFQTRALPCMHKKGYRKHTLNLKSPAMKIKTLLCFIPVSLAGSTRYDVPDLVLRFKETTSRTQRFRCILETGMRGNTRRSSRSNWPISSLTRSTSLLQMHSSGLVMASREQQEHLHLSTTTTVR